MLRDLSAADFRPFLHQQVQMQDRAGVAIAAELTEVNEVRLRPEEVLRRERKEPFSLVIRIGGSQQLDQGTYRIDFPGLGGLDIFFVPIGRDEEFCYYEAVFN
jgi:hypothetical protein